MILDVPIHKIKHASFKPNIRNCTDCTILPVRPPAKYELHEVIFFLFASYKLIIISTSVRIQEWSGEENIYISPGEAYNNSNCIVTIHLYDTTAAYEVGKRRLVVM